MVATTGFPVAVRLAGVSVLAAVVAGKPDCYKQSGVFMARIQRAAPTQQ
jgi:hypothetical protein